MLDETLVMPAPGVKVYSPAAELLKTLRAARYRIEDEGRDFSEWQARIDLSNLLGEAIQQLLALPALINREHLIDEVSAALAANDGIGSWQEAVATVNTLRAHPPACACLGLLCDSETFECSECFRTLPLCQRTDADDFDLCGDCWEAVERKAVAA